MAPPGLGLKIDRAHEHLLVLEDEMREYFRARPYAITRHVNPKKRHYRWTARVVIPIPDRWSLLVGDVLQNLRSALDHLAWALAGDDPPRSTAFPIVVTPQDYFQFNKKGEPTAFSGVSKITALHPLAQTTIEALQYYHGNEIGARLRALNELARLDRHRELSLVGSVNERTTFSAAKRDPFGRRVPFDMPPGSKVRHHIAFGPFGNDAVLAEADMSGVPDAQVDMDCEFGFDIAFSNQQVATDYSVLKLLREVTLSIRDDVFPSLTPFIDGPCHGTGRPNPDSGATAVEGIVAQI